MLSFPVNTTPPLGHFEVSLCHKVKPFIKRNHLILVTVFRLNAQVPSNSTFTNDLFSNDGGEGKDNVRKKTTRANVLVHLNLKVALHLEPSTVMLSNPNLNMNLKMNTNLYTFIRY